MPNPRAFLGAFGIHKNIQLDDAKVVKIKIGHDVIEQYKTYQFPLEIYINCEEKQDCREKLTAFFIDYFKENHTVLSQYKNPYQCWIDEIKCIFDSSTNLYKITALGHGIRVFKNIKVD